MKAAVFLDGVLDVREIEPRAQGPGEVRIAVEACGICRTDLHILDGELAQPKRPVILGHQVVGRVIAPDSAGSLATGSRVGVPWLGWTCGTCSYCQRGLENLCPDAKFTGYTLDGGLAEMLVADARYCLPLPDGWDGTRAAPLLCAGLIGHRAYRMAGDAERIGLYGFGAAAHILTQVARFEGRSIYAFTRPGDTAGKRFALEVGATWAGDSGAAPPEPLDAAILFAPVGGLVPQALQAVRPGGSVICAGIHMSDIPSFPYADLWMERSIRSVANLTRADGAAFLEVAGKANVQTAVTVYPVEDVKRALDDLRHGRHEGALVIRISP